MSFFCCIELGGPEESLLAGLAEISGPKDKMGPTFDSPKFLEGQVSMFLNFFSSVSAAK
jgi:hypothetical protein